MDRPTEASATSGRDSNFLAIVSLACALGFVALAIAQGLTSSEDTTLLRQIAAWRSPGLTAVMRGATWLGSGAAEFPFAFAVAGVIYWRRQRSRAFGYLGWSLGGWIAYGLLKVLFHRPRPKIIAHLSGGGWWSFPSGHAMLAPIIYVFAAYLLLMNTDRAGIRWLVLGLAWALVALIALSRIYLGVHYPTDVAGGLLAGAAWLGLSVRMMSRGNPVIASEARNLKLPNP